MTFTIDTTKVRSYDHTEWYDRTCKYCGLEFVTNSVQQKYCREECRLDCNRQADRHVVHMGKQSGQPFMKWRIIYDPDSECGLLPNLKISREEVNYMTAIKSFTPGTIVEHIPTKERYIIEDTGKRYKMRACRVGEGRWNRTVEGKLKRCAG